MRQRKYRVQSNLQDDRKLYGLKLTAGLVSVGLLVALFVTSLYRVSEPAWSVVLLVTAVALTALIAHGVVHGRRNGRYRFWGSRNKRR
ncbi:MAG: hypothetical protein M3143_12645 [Actinomycetota bacterium]|nr:hypothetical protein [Actinomycetota bacterium]